MNQGCHLLVLDLFPLFLDEDEYVNTRLEATYLDAYATLPRRWRDVLEGTDGRESAGAVVASNVGSVSTDPVLVESRDRFLGVRA